MSGFCDTKLIRVGIKDVKGAVERIILETLLCPENPD